VFNHGFTVARLGWLWYTHLIFTDKKIIFPRLKNPKSEVFLKMLLVIDVGNSNIVIGIYNKNSLEHNWRINTDKSRTVDEYSILIKSLLFHAGILVQNISGIIISSVVPAVTKTLVLLCQTQFTPDPLVVDCKTKTGMPVLYDNPQEVGADRIVNAVAARDKYGCPLVVIDFGTATTFDYINEKGEYCGGIIAPGLGIAADALFRKTSKLPRVEICRPPAVVARNTVNSIQAGLYFGYLGLVDGIVKRIMQETASSPKVVATGGLAPLMITESETIELFDEFLALEGMRIIYEHNM
jgi:type III pantothenate kinase